MGTKEADGSTSAIELNPTAEKDVGEKESTPEDLKLFRSKFLDTAQVGVDGLVTLAGEQKPEQLRSPCWLWLGQYPLDKMGALHQFSN